jgi:hypothetical protein
MQQHKQLLPIGNKTSTNDRLIRRSLLLNRLAAHTSLLRRHTAKRRRSDHKAPAEIIANKIDEGSGTGVNKKPREFPSGSNPIPRI